MSFLLRKFLCQGCTKRFLGIRCAATVPPTGYETSKQTIVDSFPLSWQPYLRLVRLDRPIGTYLLFWPCSWSISLAADPGQFPDFTLLATFGVGSLIMRGAGCIINDLWDRDFDGKVFRTANRPLPSGQVTPFGGLVFLAGHLSIGLCILLSLNYYSILLGMMSVPLVAIYPLMKRYTYWPQTALGLTFNWGALLGYSAVKGYCDWSICLPLYTACVSWTLLYDTIYAYQDASDDLKLGLKSTALRFGTMPQYWLMLFSISMVSSLLLVGINGGLSWPYYIGVGAVSSHLSWQIYKLDISDPVRCLKLFRSNNNIGAILLLAIIGASLIASSNKN